MTTTAHEDQFTVGTQTIERIREPYNTVSILKQNVAALEVALRTQTERAESYAETLRSLASYVGAGGYNADTVDAGVFEEKIRWGIGEIMTRAEAAEAELAKLREQTPVAWLSAENYKRICPGLGKTVAIKMNKVKPDDVALYALPIPAPAPAVPDEWRDYVFAAADELRLTVRDLKNGFVRCGNCGEQETTSDLDCVSDIDGALELLDELLQSAPATVAVTAEWREVIADLLANDGADGGRYDASKWLAARDKARALLQSAQQSEVHHD